MSSVVCLRVADGWVVEAVVMGRDYGVRVARRLVDERAGVVRGCAFERVFYRGRGFFIGRCDFLFVCCMQMILELYSMWRRFF